MIFIVDSSHDLNQFKSMI